MLGKITSLMILSVVLLPVILPAKLAIIHVAGTDKVLVTLDTCHASSPFQPASSGMPFYPEQICGCLPAPKSSVSYIALQPFFKPLLFASSKEKPPRA